jgi:hypothetical protein
VIPAAGERGVVVVARAEGDVPGHPDRDRPHSAIAIPPHSSPPSRLGSTIWLGGAWYSTSAAISVRDADPDLLGLASDDVDAGVLRRQPFDARLDGVRAGFDVEIVGERPLCRSAWRRTR